MEITQLQAASFAANMLLGNLDHPNKMPFKGVLTYLDVPSDQAPNGSNGLKVLIPKSVGEAALTSLHGMAVNYVEGSMDGHNPTEKIGVITEAYLGEALADGAIPVMIEGYVYAHDFENAAVTIKANQSVLGFSYETAKTRLMKGVYNGEQVAVVTDLGFYTGASILLRDKAAYQSTSLAASAEENKEEENLDLEKLLAELKDYVGGEIKLLREEFKPAEQVVTEPVTEVVDPVVEPVVETPVEEVTEVVEPVVEAPTEQPVTETVVETPVAEEATLNASALQAELETLKAELASLKEGANLQAAARKSIAFPTTLAAKFDLSEQDDQTKLMASIDARTDLSIEQRFALKIEAMEKVNKN